jgi:hypothetical protein
MRPSRVRLHLSMDLVGVVGPRFVEQLAVGPLPWSAGESQEQLALDPCQVRLCPCHKNSPLAEIQLDIAGAKRQCLLSNRH